MMDTHSHVLAGDALAAFGLCVLAGLVAAACALGGFPSLPLQYASREERLWQQVDRLGGSEDRTNATSNVSLDETPNEKLAGSPEGAEPKRAAPGDGGPAGDGQNVGASGDPVGASAEIGVMDVGQMKDLLESGEALILDTRPELFYRFGRIPTAINLPRDDFETAYSALKSRLIALGGKPIVLYCASASCKDARLVAESLVKLGHGPVSIYGGGWAQWTAEGMKVEGGQP